MKKLLVFCISLVLVLGSNSGFSQLPKKTDLLKTVSSKVEVYYFHFTRRCNTCQSVEKNAKQAFESLYPEKVKSGDYSFKALNLDDAANKTLADKLGVGGQTLLVVNGAKKLDITDKGFLNADNLDKMKTEVKQAVEKVLEK